MSNAVLEKVEPKLGDFVAVNGIDLRVSEGEFVTLLGLLVRQDHDTADGCGSRATSAGRISIGTRWSAMRLGGLFASERRRLGASSSPTRSGRITTALRTSLHLPRVRCKSAAGARAIPARQGAALGRDKGLRNAPCTPALSGGQQQRVANARALVFRRLKFCCSTSRSVTSTRSFDCKTSRMTSLYAYMTKPKRCCPDRVVVMDRVIQQIERLRIYRYLCNRIVAASSNTELLQANVEGASGSTIAVCGSTSSERAGWKVCEFGKTSVRSAGRDRHGSS